MPKPTTAPCILLFLLLLPVCAASAGELEPDLEFLDSPAAPAQPVLSVEQAAFLRSRAEAGDPALQCLYGLALLTGSAGRRDRTEGEAWLKRSAEAGDRRGRFEYGKLLYLGEVLEQDHATAVRYLEPLAREGNLEAAYYVGNAFILGDGMEADAARGLAWLEKAAEAGVATAQSDLGIIHFSGLAGVEKDYGKARRWFEQAARRGSGDSANKLGIMYRNGYGVPADPEQAFLWFSLGANLGDPYAQFNLANCYLNGEWAERNFELAARWHGEGAMRGGADSQYFLGCFFLEGIGVPRDAGKARQLLSMADRGGNPDARAMLERLDAEEEEDQSPPPALTVAALLGMVSGAGVEPTLRDRDFLLRIDAEAALSPSPDGTGYYLTLPGVPGVIALGMAETERPSPDAPRLEPGAELRVRLAGPPGPRGFVELEGGEIVGKDKE